MPDIHTRITQFNKDFLPDMVQLKYEAMAENIFRFYRGTCHLFYEDLSKVKNLPAAPPAWICGDMHLENFGSYKGDDRVVYFDLNDFDEGALAPANWEILRMITSILVAFDSFDIEEEAGTTIITQFLKNYSATLSKGKAIAIDPRTARGIVCTFLTAVEKRKQKDLLKKRTTGKKGNLMLSLADEKHLELDKSLKKKLSEHIQDWIVTSSAGPYNFEVSDVVFRFAGTGSVGVKRYLFLLKSLNSKKYLLLDMKQARTSSLQPYLQLQQPVWDSEAGRVISIQQRMQNVLPALLDVTLFEGDSYTLQEMQPTEDNINFELIKDRYSDMHQVIDDMAMLAASAQLRSSGRQNSAVNDELIAYGEDTNWHNAALLYARKYAEQVKKDYSEFLNGCKSGLYGEPVKAKLKG